MREVVGVRVICPACGHPHRETLKDAKLERVNVNEKGAIIEMAVTAGEQIFGGDAEDMIGIRPHSVR